MAENEEDQEDEEKPKTGRTYGDPIAMIDFD